MLIAVLDGDDSGRSQTRHVADAFEGERGFRRHLIPRCLREEEFGDTEDARRQAEATGQKWLDEYKADVLVWGKVIPGGKGLILRFLGREGGMAPGRQGSEERRSGHYPLGDTGLPLDFNADMNAVIVALTTAAVAPATERQGVYLADLLEPQAKKLQHLCTHMLRTCQPVSTPTSAAASGTRSASRRSRSASKRARAPGSKRRSPPIARR